MTQRERHSVEDCDTGRVTAKRKRVSAKGPLRVQLLAFPGATPIVPVGLLDLLRKVNALGAAPLFDVSLLAASEERCIEAAGGFRINCDYTLSTAPSAELVVVCPLDAEVLDAHSQNRGLIAFLRRRYRAGADVASVCTGAFLLAEAGLFKGKQAATHWAFHALFRQRYPDVQLLSHAIVADQGRVVSTGGATSFLNLVLFLADREGGEELARSAASLFLIDEQKAPQGMYAVFSGHKRHGDEAILRAQEALERAGGALSIEAWAKAARMSRRTFIRRFKLATGLTPIVYQQQLRIERAKRLLRGAGATVSDVAHAVGYEDLVAFRSMFQRYAGLTPSAYRERQGISRSVEIAGPLGGRAAAPAGQR